MRKLIPLLLLLVLFNISTTAQKSTPNRVIWTVGVPTSCVSGYVYINTTTGLAYTRQSGACTLVGTTFSGGTLTSSLLFSPDNSLDIGASGVTRPRTGYFATSVISNSFTGTGNTTYSSPSTFTTTFGASGTNRWQINTSGHFLASTDNTTDIGASGANRPRTGYFGTSITAPVLGSTVATGTAPLSIVSTTPVTNLHSAPTTFSYAGVQLVGAKIVYGGVNLAAGTAVVTFVGSAVFSSSGFICTLANATNTNPVKYTATSASSITITGTGTDGIHFMCIGN